MSLASEIAALFRRDLTRLLQDLEAFPDDGEALWKVLPGVTNSAGNLALHLEGNHREYIGRRLGGVAYTRQRDREFADTGVTRNELARRIGEVGELVPRVISALSGPQLGANYPENILGSPATTQQVLISLHGHLNYHLGQIDYLRRILTEGRAVEFAGISPSADGR